MQSMLLPVDLITSRSFCKSMLQKLMFQLSMLQNSMFWGRAKNISHHDHLKCQLCISAFTSAEVNHYVCLTSEVHLRNLLRSMIKLSTCLRLTNSQINDYQVLCIRKKMLIINVISLSLPQSDHIKRLPLYKLIFVLNYL